MDAHEDSPEVVQSHAGRHPCTVERAEKMSIASKSYHARRKSVSQVLFRRGTI